MKLKTRFEKAVMEVCPELGRGCWDHPVIFNIYLKMFNSVPHCIDSDILNTESGQIIDVPASTQNIIDTLHPLYYNGYGNKIIVLPEGIIYANSDDCITGWFNKPEFPKYIEKCFRFYQTSETNKYIQYVVYNNGFSTTMLQVANQDCDLNTNYNADIPHQEILNYIEGPRSGIIILHGMPGCGKTSYLRYLIRQTNTPFLFLDSSVFKYITDISLIKLLLDYRESVVVLEDCECILRDRAGNIFSEGNSLSALLNLADGILGDSLSLKFICTFNTKLSNIDPALLRKGRLLKKYEFKPLTSDRVQALASKLNKTIPDRISLPLCDIYAYNEDNGGQITKKQIGYGN